MTKVQTIKFLYRVRKHIDNAFVFSTSASYTDEYAHWDAVDIIEKSIKQIRQSVTN